MVIAAGEVVVYVIVDDSAASSSLGLIVSGSAARPEIARGPPAVAFPSVPSTGRAVPATDPPLGSRHLREDASQVQSRAGPWPVPAASSCPRESVTLTVHGTAPERRAWNRTAVPSPPVTFGSKIFGRPTDLVAPAIAPSRA